MPCLKKSLVRENEGIYLTCDTLSLVIKIHVKVDSRPGQVLIRGFNPFLTQYYVFIPPENVRKPLISTNKQNA